MSKAIQKQNKSNVFYGYLMVIAAFFWSGAFIAGKFSVQEFPVFSLTFYRFLFASMIIFLILIKTEQNWKIGREDLKTFLILAIIGMIGYHIFFFLALKYTSPVNASLIGAINPIITTILSFIFLKEVIKIKNVVAIVLSFSGVALIITNGKWQVLKSLSFNIGDLLMIIGVICWASYAILSKKALIKYSPLKVTSYAFLFCAILLIPMVILEKPWVYIPDTSLNGWLSIFYMSFFASVIGYLIHQIAIKNIGPSRSSLYINLVPLFSMILAYFFLHESISIIKLIASLLIIIGVLINIGVFFPDNKE
ncbi:Threonine/homoserine efflux transporter RhtA [Desulfonispora thiosulfatigenes DSM 11270]|uniref:Threonine/homoserine efflux transporter RhtA n=1 Tax=Desulfonispora thiosulfatigenes DSM 11270 TaxID=656914 RepID=A0A1W1ULI4_DESTI|nr:DMT family transporter [Desulfonispora thiosulfatigenes]SMB81671.1 Threonine/homoserine efflux transporter RhtA [Desulfonispora thiosulfatigenes DSM 11270]